SARPCALVIAGVAAAAEGQPGDDGDGNCDRYGGIVVGCALSGASQTEPSAGSLSPHSTHTGREGGPGTYGQHDADTSRRSLAESRSRRRPRAAASRGGLPAASRSAADILEVGWPEPALVKEPTESTRSCAASSATAPRPSAEA